MTPSRNSILTQICRALGRSPGTLAAERPSSLPPRVPAATEAEIDLLFKEINRLTGITRRVTETEIGSELEALVRAEGIKSATLWLTAELAQLQIEGCLRSLNVDVISPHAGKHALAQCDLGVTGVDFALPETGTLGLLASSEKPRAVSLLPRVHLALLRPQALRGDLHHVFAEARRHSYLILITGPSRTADIELTLTIGVHGPKALYAWCLG